MTSKDIGRLARAMLVKPLAPKTAQRHDVPSCRFALAMEEGWATINPVTKAARLTRRRKGDASPDLQFLTLHELDAVSAVIADTVVDRDALGPVLRVIVVAAATTGLRQSELLGIC